jgi:thiaminase
MKVKLNDPMKSDAVIPCTHKDRDAFKEIAAKERKSMTRLFHEWVERYEGIL